MTAAVPLAANAALGKWQIVVADRFSGRRLSVPFEVARVGLPPVRPITQLLRRFPSPCGEAR